MATIGNVTRHVVIDRDLITFEQYIIIIESYSAVAIGISLVGVVSNIINIRIFFTMGLSDSVAVSFLALATFDLTYLIVCFCLAISVHFYVAEVTSSVRFKIEPYGVFVLLGGIMIFINVTNVLTTTYIAVARCMCVAKPLQFKITFTRGRAIFLMSAFAIFAVVIYTPILANMGMVEKFDKATNTSRPSLWVSAKRETIKEGVWMVIDMFLPVVTEIIILVCVAIMARSLRAASMFRNSSVAVSERVPNTDESKELDFTMGKDVPNSITINDKLSGRELRVVQQVVLISIVYIICNIPKILISMATTVEPNFTIGKSYTKLYLVVNGIRKHFEIFNASVNLFIYYKYNRKFRSILLGQ